MLLTVKDLSAWLNIKPATLYTWANQAKIPCRRIHGLIRFDQDEIKNWLASFAPSRSTDHCLFSRHTAQADVDSLVAAAKRDVYTSVRETSPRETKGVLPYGSV